MLVVKNLPASAGDTGDVGLGRSTGRGNGYPFQYSCLENSMDRRAWQAAGHRVTKSRTQLSIAQNTHTHMANLALGIGMFEICQDKYKTGLPLWGQTSRERLPCKQTNIIQCNKSPGRSCAVKEVLELAREGAVIEPCLWVSLHSVLPVLSEIAYQPSLLLLPLPIEMTVKEEVKRNLLEHCPLSEYVNGDRLYFGGLQNHCGWWLQPWN